MLGLREYLGAGAACFGKIWQVRCQLVRTRSVWASAASLLFNRVVRFSPLSKHVLPYPHQIIYDQGNRLGHGWESIRPWRIVGPWSGQAMGDQAACFSEHARFPGVHYGCCLLRQKWQVKLVCTRFVWALVLITNTHDTTSCLCTNSCTPHSRHQTLSFGRVGAAGRLRLTATGCDRALVH